MKNDRKMPFYQRKKFNPIFFCLFIPLTCIINEKINLPKKIPRHYISARTIKDLLGSIVREGYCIPVRDIYLVLHDLCCRKNAIVHFKRLGCRVFHDSFNEYVFFFSKQCTYHKTYAIYTFQIFSDCFLIFFKNIEMSMELYNWGNL